MKYNLVSILEQLSAIYFKEIEGYFTNQELWEWMLFDEENSYLNELLEIHQPSGVPIKCRSIELDKTLALSGDYYCFTHIAHQPSYHLQKVDSLDALTNLILSKSGINNSFTTVIIPIVNGKIITIDTKKDLTSIEVNLINKIQEIISQLNNSNFNELAKQGHTCLLTFKNKGLSQQNAYDTAYFISKIYQALNLDFKEDLADEFLDYICGYIGNKKWWVWNKRL